jgi:hypothetical protein
MACHKRFVPSVDGIPIRVAQSGRLDLNLNLSGARHTHLDGFDAETAPTIGDSSVAGNRCFPVTIHY